MHAPGTLSGGPHSEHGCCSRYAHPPFVESEIATPGTYHDTHAQVPWCTPTFSLPGNNLLKHIKMELTTYGMNKQGQLKSITKIHWVFHLVPLTIHTTIYSL